MMIIRPVKKLTLPTMIYLFCFSLLFTFRVYGDTFYVDGTMAGDCDGTNYNYDPSTRSRNTGPGQIAWQHVASANAVLNAGDTVYIRGGVNDFEIYYIGERDSDTGGIDPEHSGTDADHRITYAVYPGEKVHFIGSQTNSRAVYIEDQDWIRVTGHDGETHARNFKFSNMYHFLRIWSASKSGGEGSHYNEIDHCEFTSNVDATSLIGWPTDYRGSTIYRNSQYNWIHHSTFSKFGFYKSDEDGGALFELGWESSTSDDNTAYNVIENCTFFHGGHHTFGLHRMFNVLRNNHFHNEKWWYYSADGKYYGYRNLYVAGDTGSAYHGYNLIEGNRISHASPNVDPINSGGGGISLNQANDILRYNDFYANGLGGIFVQCGPGEACGGNHIYNNSWLSNGFLDDSIPSSATGATDEKRRPICVWIGGSSWDHYENIVIKNNLMWKNQQGPEGGDQIITDGDYIFRGGTEIANNWADPDGDPQFMDEGCYSSPSMSDPDFSACDPHSTSAPNLSLQSGSPAINQGIHLTHTVGLGGDSTTLIVNDAKYFQPGWGDGAGGGALVHADMIAIGSVNNAVVIHSIDYDTNTITLATAMSWNDNDPVWLYSKSDGEVVLRNDAPDMGAHEYDDGGSNSGGGTGGNTGSSDGGGSSGGCFLSTLLKQ